MRNKLRQKFGSSMQNKCSYIIYLTSEKNKLNKRKLYPTLPGWSTCVYGKFSSHLSGIRQKQVRSLLGGLAHFSYEHIIFSWEFLKEGEISPR